MLRFVRAHALVFATAAVALLFVASGRISIRVARSAIDYDVLLILFALLLTVEILRYSGLLDRIVAAVVSRFHRTRSLSFALVALAGAMACLITNDVALFVIVPFTIIAGRMTALDVEDVIVLEIIATNLIGCLTPLGNPQNLFVYHASGWSAAAFVNAMLPFVALNALGLAIAVMLLGRSQRVQLVATDLPPLRKGAAITGAICFMLVALEIARVAPAWIPAAAAGLAAVVVLRERILRTDLSIVPLFFFAFIVVAGLQTFPASSLTGGGIYAAAIAISQVISNVPATVLLSPFVNGDWRELLLGVNAGGCGTIIASLANLLGWRIYVRESNRDPRFFRRLTVLNFIFLLWAGTAGWLLLQ